MRVAWFICVALVLALLLAVVLGPLSVTAQQAYPIPGQPIEFKTSLQTAAIRLYVWDGAAKLLEDREISVEIRIGGESHIGVGFVESFEEGVAVLRVLRKRGDTTSR